MPCRLRSILAITLSVWITITICGRAQQTDQQSQAGAQPATTSPTPTSNTTEGASAQAPENSAGGQEQPAPEQTPTPPDTRPLAGAQAIMPTLPAAGRSFILPSFSVWESADTNAPLMPGYSGGVEPAAIPEGNLDLHHLGRNNSLDMSYGAGGLIYETNLNQSAAFQSFAVDDQYTARRWNFFIADRVNYFPQAAAGFGGIGFAGVFNNTQSLGLGSGTSELNPAYAPEQSILTGRAGVTSETAIAQVQYFLSSKTSVSALGSFGYQYYSQTGLISGNDRFGTLSIDHQLTATESVSVSYSITEFRYSGGSVAISDNLWRVGYGHRVSNHVTLTLLGGPELTYSAIYGVFGVRQRLSWGAQGRLAYHLDRTSVSLSYLHYLTPGSGVFQGAETSTANAGLHRELSRTWLADLNIGWTKNGALSAYSLNPFFINPGNINYEFGSARLSHNLGRSLRAFAAYQLQREQSSAAFLFGSTLLVRQVFGVGLEWHPRPFGF